MSALRHKSRQAALQIMYQLEKQTNIEQAINDYFSHFDLSEGGREFASSLVEGTCGNKISIDEKIEQHSDKWRLDRMAVIDKNILRLAAFELFFSDEKTPRKVILNEWIEVAKRFGSDQSSKFINGILDNML